MTIKMLTISGVFMRSLTLRQPALIIFFVCILLLPLKGFSNTGNSSLDILMVGKTLPDAQLKSYGIANVEINSLKGKIKIISVVPQLNTPVCDKQTHQFSETNNGLDQHIDIITVSTNTPYGQYEFAKKANIHNLFFLSDNLGFQFGRSTGLLIEGMGVLRRTIIIADKDNIIRYVDFVPGGGLPNINKALKAASDLLKLSKAKG
jgi:thioredoxin-dependent peroxiredoxin